MSTAEPPVSQSELDVRSDLDGAHFLRTVGKLAGLEVRLAQGVKNLWLLCRMQDVDVAALRLGPNAGEITNVRAWSKSDDTAGIEFTTPLGPMRANIAFHEPATLRCTTSLLPATDTRISSWPRDLYALTPERGTVHTHQRGLRSGIVFATCASPEPFTVFYFQNFTSLNDYFGAVKRPPADTVGGQWPELGYAPPSGDDCILPKANEVVISDAYLSFANDAPTSEEAIAGRYLDMLAGIYVLLERPATTYHHWPERAEKTLRDLSLSPRCTYVRQSERFLMPYVGDSAKPPESMVQFTLGVNTAEYDRWRNRPSGLAAALRGTAPKFFNEELGTIVRWLPGESFDESQAEDNMSHEAMDSWYYYHALFNVFRFASEGDAVAKELFARSLPYAIRLAHRFNYRWPIFFDLKTLDVIRAEGEPGAGGETDVAGLYALVMIHAHEMFGDREYRQEAEIAVSHLGGLGFTLAYQLNTTGFAAEAALRLWKITRVKRYLELAEVCLANLFDNMWLWECDYGNAASYRTFFGLFPLRDAPYLAAYEELEAHAKFHEFLELGGDDVRPSLRLLIAESQRYSLDRCWYYYPDALPAGALAGKVRNGKTERALSIPLEDLQDGFQESGQVGQEIYGAGIGFVMTSRHYMQLACGATAYSSYPMFDFTPVGERGATWRAGGDSRLTAEVRVFMRDADCAPCAINAFARAGEVRVPLRGSISPEGHATFPIRGGQVIEIECVNIERDAASGEIVIGTLAAHDGKDR
jgi:hypothetical protein